MIERVASILFVGVSVTPEEMSPSRVQKGDHGALDFSLLY